MVVVLFFYCSLLVVGCVFDVCWSLYVICCLFLLYGVSCCVSLLLVVVVV